MSWFKENDPAIRQAIAAGMIPDTILPPVKTQGPGPETWDEKEFQRRVTQVADENGWKWFHPKYSYKSTRGYPDLTLVRDRVIWIELKVRPNEPEPDQLNWYEALRAADQLAFIFYPEDFPAIVEMLTQKGGE